MEQLLLKKQGPIITPCCSFWTINGYSSVGCPLYTVDDHWSWLPTCLLSLYLASTFPFAFPVSSKECTQAQQIITLTTENVFD